MYPEIIENKQNNIETDLLIIIGYACNNFNENNQNIKEK